MAVAFGLVDTWDDGKRIHVIEFSLFKISR
jgi:hypothetical protein